MNPPSSLHTEHLAPLLDRLRDGDLAAADELIRRSEVRLQHLARRMLRGYPRVRSQVETLDLVQEASLRLLKALKEVTPEHRRDFYALAAVQIRRQLIDLARRSHRQAYKPLHDQAEPVAAGSQSTEVDDLDRWTAFHEAVEKLEGEERAVVDLRFYHGSTWPEIAQVLGVNERTARRDFDSACLTLREALSDWLPSLEENG